MLINLISGPRNVSTALMYSFAQRQDTKVVDEPFYGYYLKLTGIIHPGRKRIMQSMSTEIDEITNKLLAEDKNGQITFLKNMAHHHINVDEQFMHAANNVFLIRNPAELLVSFSKVIKEPTIDDIGVKKSSEIFEDLVSAGKQPVVIDSGELLKDPLLMLERLCQAIGIRSDPNMQCWPAGPREEDGIWAEYWYHNVHKSIGFIKSEPKAVEVPKELQATYEEAMIYYKDLYKKSLKYN
jgi:hypothetical protein